MSTETSDWVYIRSTVEHPGGLDEEWATYPRAEWEALTGKEREAIRVEMAVNHQTNVAPCGASEADDVNDVPDDVLADPEGHRL